MTFSGRRNNEVRKHNNKRVLIAEINKIIPAIRAELEFCMMCAHPRIVKDDTTIIKEWLCSEADCKGRVVPLAELNPIFCE